MGLVQVQLLKLFTLSILASSVIIKKLFCFKKGHTLWNQTHDSKRHLLKKAISYAIIALDRQSFWYIATSCYIKA